MICLIYKKYFLLSYNFYFLIIYKYFDKHKGYLFFKKVTTLTNIKLLIFYKFLLDKSAKALYYGIFERIFII